MESPFEWLKNVGEATFGFVLCVFGSSVFWHSVWADAVSVGSGVTAIGGGFLTLNAVWRWYKVYGRREPVPPVVVKADQHEAD